MGDWGGEKPSLLRYKLPKSGINFVIVCVLLIKSSSWIFIYLGEEPLEPKRFDNGIIADDLKVEACCKLESCSVRLIGIQDSLRQVKISK